MLLPLCHPHPRLMVHISFVCRILNKLTPDKFDKLCHELLGVGIETKYILKGVILLVSEAIIIQGHTKDGSKRINHFLQSSQLITLWVN